MAIAIREGALLDASSILSVIQQSYTPFLDEIPIHRSLAFTLEEIKTYIEDQRCNLWVAVDEEGVVGVAAGIAYVHTAYHLKLLFVSAKMQNQGVASSLLTTFERSGQEMGYGLFTSNYQTWAPWSRDFYLKHGYKEYEFGDESLCADLCEPIAFLENIGKLNNDCKRFIWKKAEQGNALDRRLRADR
jgi:GNAT superfamily N-acetyltransferase